MKLSLCGVLIQFCLCLSSAVGECGVRDIRMTNGTIRMDNGSYYMAGGLQVCINDQWATVCQHNFDRNDATVACRQLGLDFDGNICLNSCFGNIRTMPAHNNYRCSGNEQTLQECGQNVVRDGCGQAAGVYCALPKMSLSTCMAPTPTTSASGGTVEDPTTTSVTTKETSSHDSSSSCSPLPTTAMCQKCSEGDRNTSDTVRAIKTEGMDSQEQHTCVMSFSSTLKALSALIAVLGLALVGVCAGLLVMCIRLQRHKLSSVTRKSARPTDVIAYRVTASPDNKPPQTNWSMDNTIYDEMTDLPNDSHLSSAPQDLASPYLIPIKLIGKKPENCESVEVEGFYDLASLEENSTADGGDYSMLNHSKSKATCGSRLSRFTNNHDSGRSFPLNGGQPERDSVYQTLNDDEEDLMYSSVN